MALQWPYWIGLAVGAALFGYQQWLIRNRERDACFKAFLNNNGFGIAVFLGVASSFV
jgi:4-hydroxybenzoate polyprenyltransferase